MIYLAVMASLFGLSLLSYGIFCAWSRSIWVGWRGYPLRKVEGRRGFVICFTFIFGGFICVLAGLTSWSIPSEVFKSLWFVGGSLPFIGNLDGMLFGK